MPDEVDSFMIQHLQLIRGLTHCAYMSFENIHWIPLIDVNVLFFAEKYIWVWESAVWMKVQCTCTIYPSTLFGTPHYPWQSDSCTDCTEYAADTSITQSTPLTPHQLQQCNCTIPHSPPPASTVVCIMYFFSAPTPPHTPLCLDHLSECKVAKVARQLCQGPD